MCGHDELWDGGGGGQSGNKMGSTGGGGVREGCDRSTYCPNPFSVSSEGGGNAAQFCGDKIELQIESAILVLKRERQKEGELSLRRRLPRAI